MITLTKNGNAIVFTFSDNAHYLFDGTIEVPVNSLTLITDNSQMATFKKSASNDIFISATYAELGMSKSELESWFKENACGSTGGGGVTSGEVETMIETSLEDYYDIDDVDAALSAKANTATTYTKTEVDTALANKADTATTYTKTEVDNALGDKADTSAVTASIAAAVSGKQDTLIAGSGITISGNVISSEGGNKVVELTQAQYDALVDKDPDTFYIITDASAIDINNYYTKTEVNTALAAKANTATTYNKTEVDTALAAKANTATTYTKTEVDTALANKADTSAVTEAISSAVSGKVNTSAYNAYTAATDSRLAEDEEVTAAGLNALNDALGDKADTSAVTASIAAAVSGKQDTLIAGSGITISGNVISSEGGGATYSAGTNISIDSANTINCTLPLSATGANNKSVIGGRNCSATNSYSFVYGDGNKHTGGSCGVVFGSSCTVENNYTFAGGWLSNSKKEGSFTYGRYVIANNKYEHSVGQYNNSVSSSTTFGDSGNTLFSVGNGTAENARHNAFEVRQNGDIYVNDGTNDVKLQDYLQIKAVKITQAAYDALVTKDPNTLYVIVD